MAKTTSKDAIILVGGYKLSTDFISYEVRENVNPLDVTGFTEGCQNFVPGLLAAEISGSALWNNDANASTPALKSLTGSTTVSHVSILPEGGTAGGPALTMPFMLGGITPSGAPNAPISLGALNFSSAGANEGVENAVILHHGTITASTTDNGISDIQGATGDLTTRISATLHVWQATTTDSYVVKVQSSTDDITYTDVITFALTGQALGSERQTIAAAARKQYQRVQATRTGAVGETFGFSVLYWRDPLAST